jgi:hypothetical protein
LKPTLKELVNSFDFAHVQVGVRFGGNGEPPHVDGVYFSDDFVSSNVERGTYYTGSEYPTSSLVRMGKYSSRGKFSKKEYLMSTLKILSDIVNRGFRDYDDFKDQMDAIDLGLSEYAECYNLFESMKEHGLVKSEK